MLRSSTYFILTSFILVCCSDDETVKEEYLYFEYNGKVLDLKWKLNSYYTNQLLVDFTKTTETEVYYKEGCFLFAAGSDNGFSGAQFQNPTFIQDAPCFVITKNNNSNNSCGHLLLEGMAGYCSYYDGYVDKDLSSCDVNNEVLWESLLNPDVYDQHQVYMLIDGYVEVITSNCYTFTFKDFWGTYTQTNCDLEGTFWAEYLNQFGQSLSITNGKYRLNDRPFK